MDFGLEALVAALLAGSGVKLADLIGGVRRRRRDGSAQVQTAEIADAAAVRAELWQELRDQRRRLDDMRTDLDRSRREYTRLHGEHVQLQADHRELRREHDDLLEKHSAVEAELEQLRARR